MATRHASGPDGRRVAVVGAGPVGLALALHAARLLPQAHFAVFDARGAGHDVAADPRPLAMALGSVHFLQRLRCWPEALAAPITAVHVSQVPPSPGAPQVVMRAAEMGVPQLGAVLHYGTLVARLQRAWLEEVERAPQRLAMHFERPVARIEPQGPTVRVDAGAVEHYDLVVLAEGGVYAEQARKALARDYGQTAWVGTVMLEGATAGLAVERFTRQGPLALLPLPAASVRRCADGAPAAGLPAALVACVARDDDPLRGLQPEQQRAWLNAQLPPAAGRISDLGPLKDFALGLNAERSLVQGRIVRIGNAAQTLHPVAGQGLNLGLRDAHALVSALRHAVDLEAALQRLEWARAPDRWGTMVLTDFLARAFTWQMPGLGGARALGLAAVQAAPALRAALARRMMFGLR